MFPEHRDAISASQLCFLVKLQLVLRRAQPCRSSGKNRRLSGREYPTRAARVASTVAANPGGRR